MGATLWYPSAFSRQASPPLPTWLSFNWSPLARVPICCRPRRHRASSPYFSYVVSRATQCSTDTPFMGSFPIPFYGFFNTPSVGFFAIHLLFLFSIVPAWVCKHTLLWVSFPSIHFSCFPFPTGVLLYPLLRVFFLSTFHFNICGLPARFSFHASVHPLFHPSHPGLLPSFLAHRFCTFHGLFHSWVPSRPYLSVPCSLRSVLCASRPRKASWGSIRRASAHPDRQLLPGENQATSASDDLEPPSFGAPILTPAGYPAPPSPCPRLFLSLPYANHFSSSRVQTVYTPPVPAWERTPLRLPLCRAVLIPPLSRVGKLPLARPRTPRPWASGAALLCFLRG